MTQGEKPMLVKNKCPVEWNPGTWPYAARCVLGKGHKGKCVDRRGQERPDSTMGNWMMGHE